MSSGRVSMQVVTGRPGIRDYSYRLVEKRHLQRQFGSLTVDANCGEADAGDVPYDGLVRKLELEVGQQ